MAATDDAGVLLDCERMREKALRAAKRTHPDIALLVSRSILVRPLSIGGRLLSPGTPEWFREVERGTQDFLGELRPLVGRIVIVEPFPDTSTSMIDCLANSGSPASCSEPSMHLPGTEEIASYWRSLPNTATVSLDGLICPRRMCPAVVDGVQTHVDTNHLTIAFSRHIAPRLDAYLRGHGIFLARGEAAPTHAVRSSRVESSGEPTT